MSNLKSDDDDDYKFLRIIDAMASINQKVNLIGVITEIGISKQSRGTGAYTFLFVVSFQFLVRFFHHLSLLFFQNSILSISYYLISGGN
ncbi:hypothetical protein Hanom_Chr14g01282501 [Helianthus anomalus]